MKRVVILARASSGKQVIQGDTLDDQIAQCTAYAESQGWEVVKVPQCSLKYPPFLRDTQGYEKQYINHLGLGTF